MKKGFSSCVAIVLAFLAGFVLGMWAWASRETMQPGDVSMCEGGVMPDKNGCCPGEVYTDMYDLGFNCCPEVGGDCFPPLR